MAELHVRMLERAEEILGGPDEVAAYLGVPSPHLRIWMRGMFSPPADVFLKLVDLISDGKPPPSSRGDGEPRRARARHKIDVGQDSIVDVGDAVDSGKASVRPKTA